MTLLEHHSILPIDLLSAYGTHRYYADDVMETANLVGDLSSSDRQFFAIEVAQPEGFKSSYHKHECGQITLILAGTMLVTTDHRSYIVPPGHFFWMPQDVMHMAEADSDVRFMSVYTENEAIKSLPDECCVSPASSFLTSIFKRVITHQLKRDFGPVYEALLLLFYDELGSMRSNNISVPMPRDPRLRRVCDEVIRNPSASISKEDMAGIGNVSARTMTRLFKSELNLTFSEWVHHVVTIAAIAKLSSRGAIIANVASELGYDSPSAFSAMFRRQTGQTPSEFLTRIGRG